MKLKISPKWLSILLTIVLTIFFLIIIFFPSFDLFVDDLYTKSSLPADSQIAQNQIEREPVESAQDVVFPEQTSFGLPIRLKIPKINVDAAVENVGLDLDGAMDVPKNSDNVAWFELGPNPGDYGSAVLAGHYGRWKDGRGSVFDRLNELEIDDVLYVEGEKGTAVFVVREFRIYNQNDDALEVFSSNDGKAHLNLITCGGVWDKATESYPKRLVVFADKK